MDSYPIHTSISIQALRMLYKNNFTYYIRDLFLNSEGSTSRKHLLIHMNGFHILGGDFETLVMRENSKGWIKRLNPS